MRIVKSNLLPSQESFITEELAYIEKIAMINGIALLYLDIELKAESLKEVLPDEQSFANYADRKALEQNYRICGNKIWGHGYTGVLYGFYAFMRQHYKVYFAGLNDEEVLFYKECVKEPNDIIPQVPFRGMNGVYPELDKEYIFKFLRYMARNQWNLLMFHIWRYESCEWRDELIDFSKLCGVEFHIGGHSMENFFPEATFQEHPEYFAYRDGARRVKGSVYLPDLKRFSQDSYLQPCFSNEECVTFMATNIAQYIENHPEIKVFSLWPHDGANNWCQCENCLKIIPYDQVLSLAKKVLELCPRPIYIEVLAYCSLLNIPQEENNLERIYTIFCPYLRQYKSRFYEIDNCLPRLGYSYPEPEPVNPDHDADYGVLLKDWKKYLHKNGGTLGIFAYYQLLFFDEKNSGNFDRSRYFRFPNINLVVDELRHFVADKMKVYYDCSCPYPNSWPDARLYSFHSQILLNPTCDTGKLIKRHEEAFLGKARDAVNKVTRKLDCHDYPITDEDIKDFALCSGIRGDRVVLWGKYVKLGSMAAYYRENNMPEKADLIEQQIIELFEENRDILNPVINVDALINFAKTFLRKEISQSNIIA